MAAILALNSGSSSLKFRLAADDGQILMAGQATRLGTPAAHLVWQAGADGEARTMANAGHGEILAALSALIARAFAGEQITAVGHRIVHGGVDFSDAVVIDAAVFGQIRALVPLAPLHQPSGILGIEAARLGFPGANQVAVFDTGFHRTKPWLHDSYAIDGQYYQAGIRRYGFHGISCQSVLRQLGDPKGRVIIAHLGNGCSVTAVKNGRSHASSMGFSTLDGVAMGTRPGHLDPGVLLHWMRQGADAAEIERRLYHQSGLLALSGLSNDVRDLQASADPRARQALEYFVARIAEEIARMAATMGGVDRVIFCGGIGENAHDLRAEILGAIEFLGSAAGLTTLVISTDEEGEIILQTRALTQSAPASGL